MVKAVLFDIDGVVLEPRVEYFSEKYAREQEVPVEKLLPFFKGVFKDCVRGKANLREELEKVMKDWEWDGSVEELLEYWFEGEGNGNQDLLQEVENLRDSGVLCYLASDIDNQRSIYLLSGGMKLEDDFDGEFLSCDIGHTKDEPEFWDEVKRQLVELELKPEDIIFFDDDEKNVETARRAGIKAELF